jgi:hypothetical protein
MANIFRLLMFNFRSEIEDPSGYSLADRTRTRDRRHEKLHDVQGRQSEVKKCQQGLESVDLLRLFPFPLRSGLATSRLVVF